jgi:hypothetical protein
MSIEAAMMTGLAVTLCIFVTLGLIAKQLRHRQMMDSSEAAAKNPDERTPPVPLVWMQSVY